MSRPDEPTDPADRRTSRDDLIVTAEVVRNELDRMRDALAVDAAAAAQRIESMIGDRHDLLVRWLVVVEVTAIVSAVVLLVVLR